MRRVIVYKEGKFEYIETNNYVRNYVAGEFMDVDYPFINGARIEYYPMHNRNYSRLVIYALDQKILDCPCTNLISLTEFFNYYASKSSQEITKLKIQHLTQNNIFLDAKINLEEFSQLLIERGIDVKLLA